MAHASIRGEAMVVTDGADDQTLARDMIEVHGSEAATVARENARAAALAGQAARAKQWIRVLGFVRGSSLAKDRQSGPPLERGPESAAQWRVAYTQRRSRVSL